MRPRPAGTGPRHFLYYWPPAAIDRAAGRRRRGIAGAQLRRVASGDVVWIVSARARDLRVHARVGVAEVAGFAEARRRLRRKNLWPSDCWIFATETIRILRRGVPLAAVAPTLRFARPARDRLTVVGGRVDPRQLQTMRRLAVASALRLERAWSRHRRRSSGADDVHGVRAGTFTRASARAPRPR